ncbi:MAG: peptide ABC transporter permease, partial [Spirochaetia bacterium]|nr:peptide ABC transporter permease [Spirochaetia bacterium]
MDRLLLLEEQGRLSGNTTNRTLRKIAANPLAIIGLVLFLILFLACMAAPLISTHGPNAIDLRSRLSPPSRDHLLGT